jgi:hypothetical protein
MQSADGICGAEIKTQLVTAGGKDRAMAAKFFSIHTQRAFLANFEPCRK